MKIGYHLSMNVFTAIRMAVFGLAALSMAVVSGCSDSSASSDGTSANVVQVAHAKSSHEAAETVVASIEPLSSVLRSMLGDGVKVVTLLPSGRSPHGFNATAAQMRDVSEANLVVTVGLGIDPWAEQAAKAAGGTETSGESVKIVSMAGLLGVQGVAFCASCGTTHGHDHAHAHESKDEAQTMPQPQVNGHLWLDPVRMKQFVEALETQLLLEFPERQNDIVTNTAKLKQELDQLNADYKFMLDEVPNKKLITFHNAFDLLAERYGLKVVAHLAEIEAHGPSVTAKEMRQVKQAVERYNLNVIYREPQMPKSAADAIVSETNVNLLVLDPLGKPGESYGELMRRNLEVLQQGQRE